MKIVLRVIVCLMCLTSASIAYADEALLQSEQDVQAAYQDAIRIVQSQKPSLLGALEDEQDDWRDLREKHCKEANANLPSKYDKQESIDFCKANMNRQRANVLRGKRPNGKDW